MRRLLAWGRQDPLCPAEASPPPLLSAFQSPCPSSILPSPNHHHPHLPPPSSTHLFSDIERQLSAKLVADPPLQIRTARTEAPLQQQLEQPSPPTGTASSQSSPVEPPTSAPSTPATHSSGSGNNGIDSQQNLATTKANNNNNNNLLAAVAAVAAAQQQQQQSPTTTATTAAVAAQQLVAATTSNGPPQQQKGIDAFLAALANTTSNGNGASEQQRAAQEDDNAPGRQQMPKAEPGQPQFMPAPSQPQQLAQSIQQAANNALAANIFANALTAQQQQRPADSLVPGPSSLLTNLNKTPLPQLVAQQQQNSVASGNNNGSSSSSGNLTTLSQGAINALQLVQQSTMQQLQRQHQQQEVAAKAALSPGGMAPATAVLLNRLSMPNILRSVGPGPSQSKPIPLLNERVNLLQFKRKEPREWSSDDVVAWILDVARRHQIPCENVNLAKFATCSGPLLMLMNEQSFKEHDPNYGSLLFAEFCKLVTDENFIDEWMKVNSAVAGPSSAITRQAEQQQKQQQQQQQGQLLQQTAQNLLGQLAIQQEKQQQQRLAAAAEFSAPGPSSAAAASGNLLLSAAVVAAQQRQQPPMMQPSPGRSLPPLNQLLLPPPAGAPGLLMQPPAPRPGAPSSAIASLSRMLHPMPQQQQQGTSAAAAAMLMNKQRTQLMMAQQQQQQRGQQMMMMKPGTSSRPGGTTGRGVGRPPGSKIEKQIRCNKDGRPRKRSQHTKGNKLWEFIRDALKDPRTCPSVVRWEDPSEGVFRIVESERLAFLWGQKKNNQKMTYEKLSRAMRTYYEKDILVPVPKSGLYPKKLVYKFGPSAHGWRMAATLAVQAQLARPGGPVGMMAM